MKKESYQPSIDEIISMHETIRLKKMDVVDLNRQIKNDECDMLRKIIDNGHFELLRIDHSALSRLSKPRAKR